jgi:hypothetical protein
MAQITNLGSDYNPVWIWDVTNSVGPTRPNDRSDVALVQLLLNQIIRVKDLRDSRKPFYQGLDDPMTGRVHGYPLLSFLDVDGWFGPETANAISTYQASASGFLVRDGVIDPVYPLVSGGALPFQVVSRAIFQLNSDGLKASGKMLNELTFPRFLHWTDAA